MVSKGVTLKKAILVIAIILIASSAFGECLRGNLIRRYPDHHCLKPFVPPCVSNGNCTESDWKDLKQKIQIYRDCITEYADNVEKDIECAKQKSSDAIDEYNNFIEKNF
jgi:hypothetical protein